MNLPSPFNEMVRAFNTKDSELFLYCFTKDAEVHDRGENQSAVGHEEIKSWFQGSFTKFDFSTEPYEFDKSTEKIFLKAKVAGNFPGSPINFLYECDLNGDRIKKLEISILGQFLPETL